MIKAVRSRCGLLFFSSNAFVHIGSKRIGTTVQSVSTETKKQENADMWLWAGIIGAYVLAINMSIGQIKSPLPNGTGLYGFVELFISFR